MRILVTGSAGFIGSQVAQRLLRDGHHVTGIDAMVPYYDLRLKDARLALLAREPGFTQHRIDLTDRAALDAVLAAEPPHVVLHLAAQAGVRHAIEHPATYLHHNVQATFSLLEALRPHPVGHLLLASTSSVYGASTQLPFLEEQALATPLNIYAATKLATEHMAHAHAHIVGLPTTAFRFFTVYGPWGRPDMAFFSFTRAIFRGERIQLFNHGEMERDFTYVDDLVEAIVRLIPVVPQVGRPVADRDSLSTVAPFRVVNLGNAQPVALRRFVAAIEAATGRTALVDLAPMRPGEVERTWADTRLLQALTGFQPNTPIDVGISRFVAWYRDYYRDEA